MSTTSPSLVNPTLSSLWDGLSPYLIASFYQVRRVGQGRDAYWERIADSPIVKAPLTDANLEMVLNWQSPFEQAGPETRAPAIFAMLQSGTLQPVIDALNPLKSDKQTSGKYEAGTGTLSQFEGRTGITKLNSTQVFNGMPPVKITVTALFRAWANAATEVEAPFEQLMQWALPVHLDADSTILSRAAEAVKGGRDWVDALMPSQSPVKIAMQYKGRCYSPLVIESIGVPLNSPVTSEGKYVSLLVPLTLCSLTAIDRKDWRDSQRSEL
ncbi:MAG: hypothetical protein LBS49_12785 [Candidatus Accumulibacter sp.]|jgi:hypothetical protein|nr:hypothetical protein [Accumulibacter sp.]